MVPNPILIKTVSELNLPFMLLIIKTSQRHF